MKKSELSRRGFMRSVGLMGLAGTLGGGIRGAVADHNDTPPAEANTVTLPFAHGERQIVQYPQKRPLILLTSDGIQLETPFSVFDENLITPNDAFFVRYHNGRVGTPLRIDGAAFRINVGGNVTTPLSLSVDDLKTKFTPVEMVALCMCTGNSRGHYNVRVPGGQWSHGAMGNARWTGVYLKDVLAMASVGAGAVQVTFNGLDFAKQASIPDFIKAVNIDFALSSDAILAYAMNGEDLPMLNGYPVRLVIPGYTGTYWVKHLTDITVINEVFTGFYMGTAYREPDNDCACVPPGTTPTSTRPVTYPRTRSHITNLVEGAIVQSGAATTVRGFAFDLLSGVKSVLFSANGGATWGEATLSEDMGKYAFRGWSTTFTPGAAGAHALKVKAIGNSGETQPETQYWQPTGYGYNPIETVNVTAI